VPDPVNRLDIQGRVTEISPLRFTPAGVAVLEILLEHESEVIEAGQPRRLMFSVPVILMGDLARMHADKTLGTVLQVSGFMAPARKDSPRFKLHAQQVKQI